MSPVESASIVGFAGCTSLGYSLGSTLAAMGAGLSNFSDTGLKSVFDTPVVAASLLDRDTPRLDRLTELTKIGLAEVQTALSGLGLAQAPLMVGLASDLDAEAQELLRNDLRASPAVQREPALFPYGRASTFLALEAAMNLVNRGAHRCIVVGGIDSLCSRPEVQWLLDTDRLVGPHVDGTIPGEAAVFLIVARSDDPLAGSPSAVTLEGVVQHKSDVPFTKMDQPSGDALAAVFGSFRQRGVRRVDRIIAAHSGEGHFGRSFAHAYLRQLEVMPEPLNIELIADCVGDVGAAAGTLGLAFAMYRMVTDARAGARSLVYSESDTGELGAAIIEGTPISWDGRTAA